MKTTTFRISLIAASAALLTFNGCNRQIRSNPEKDTEHQATTTDQGGGTLTKGSAGDPKNFGDTHAKVQKDGVSPSNSPTGWSKDTPVKQPADAKSPDIPTAPPPAPNNSGK